MDNLETKLGLMSLVNTCYCNSLMPYSDIDVCKKLSWWEKKLCFLGGARETMDIVLCLCSSSRWSVHLPVMPCKSSQFRTRHTEKGKERVGVPLSEMDSWNSVIESLHLYDSGQQICAKFTTICRQVKKPCVVNKAHEGSIHQFYSSRNWKMLLAEIHWNILSSYLFT